MLKRFKWGVRVTSLVVGLAVTCAMAFFIGAITGSGSHTGTAGEGGSGAKNVPVKIEFPDGQLTPTHAVSLTAEVENNTTKRVTFHHIAFPITTGAAGCLPAWLEVKAVSTGGANAEEVAELQAQINGAAIPGSAFSYPSGETLPVVRNSNMGLMLVLKENGLDESACEGQPVTVSAHLE